MMRPGKKLLVLLLPLILATLACRAAYRLLDPAAYAPTATVETIYILVTTTPEPTPSPSATSTATPPAPTPTVTPSRQPPSATPTVIVDTRTPTTTPLPVDLQLRVFEDLWNTINEDYLYADFNGLDWGAIYDEYLARIRNGLTNAEFYAAMDEIVFRLGDEHSVFLSPELVAIEDREYEGNYDYAGIGVLVSAVPERNRAVVLLTFPGSPAEQAGLKARDSILEVNEEAILDVDGYLKDIIRGPVGSVVTLLVQTPGEEPRPVNITRQRINSAMPVPYIVLELPDGKRIGYILLITFSDQNVDDFFGDALEAMSAEGPLDGLIIDNRQNGGGADTVLRPTLAYFTSGTLGYFISRNGERPLEVRKTQDIQGSQQIPLVILIGPDTASYGEVFAGVLQDIGRAYLIGDTTDGNVETLWGYDFEDGSRVWLARESFRPLNHPEQDWELTGIIPDLTLPVNWDEYTIANDPAVLAGIEYLVKNQP